MTARETLRVGAPVIVTCQSEDQPLATVFEDDGETGYFYALELRHERQIVDAVHIYNVDAVLDRNRDSEVEILWSADNLRSLLLIDGYPHAVFDFSAKRGYCRTGFPTTATRGSDAWQRHEWADSLVDLFRPTDHH